jgi:hypothetical protein
VLDWWWFVPSCLTVVVVVVVVVVSMLLSRLGALLRPPVSVGVPEFGVASLLVACRPLLALLEHVTPRLGVFVVVPRYLDFEWSWSSWRLLFLLLLVVPPTTIDASTPPLGSFLVIANLRA